MKLTKSKLKQIIREELKSTLQQLQEIGPGATINIGLPPYYLEEDEQLEEEDKKKKKSYEARSRSGTLTPDEFNRLRSKTPEEYEKNKRARKARKVQKKEQEMHGQTSTQDKIISPAHSTYAEE